VLAHGDYTWDCDAMSRDNLTATVTAVNASIPLPQGFTWRTHDNQDVPMDGPALVALAAAMLAQVQLAYVASWQRKAAVDAAATVAEIVAC
jgi:hypothetical protein